MMFIAPSYPPNGSPIVSLIANGHSQVPRADAEPAPPLSSRRPIARDAPVNASANSTVIASRWLRCSARLQRREPLVVGRFFRA